MMLSVTPEILRPPVWPLPLSLATTSGISVDVFSSPYLDVSVQAVPLIRLWIHRMIPCGGFPHSEISGSQDICSSPKLIAACHVLHRLLMPRHSPCALISLTFVHVRQANPVNHPQVVPLADLLPCLSPSPLKFKPAYAGL